MQMTFRWFGETDDSVSLQQIRQIPNCKGIMGTINYEAGEIWDEDVIKTYVDHVHKAGLAVEVIESVNVHEDIKMGLPSRDRYIENYRQTIRNLAKYGVKVIVYNFMPVFDWLRTDLSHPAEDGSQVMYFDYKALQNMTPLDIVARTAEQSGGFSLPGWEPKRLKELARILDIYKDISEEKLRSNLGYFLRGIIPVCESVGVKMALHPDDPALPVFGIPRVARSKEDLDQIIRLVDSPANGICFCTGAFGSSPDNDVVNAIRYFGKKKRIPCAHVRNIRFLGDKRFCETSHFSEDGDFDMYAIMKALYESGFDGYIRPDHGRMIWGEKARPGYGLFDRALGLTYLNGIWESLQKGSGNR